MNKHKTEMDKKNQNIPRSALDISATPLLAGEPESFSTSFSSSVEQSSSMTLPSAIVPYSDTNQDRRLMIYVSLQSGSKPSDLDVNVSDCGHELILKQAWPKLLMDPERLLSRYIDENGHPEYDSNHTVVAGFRTAIRKLKTQSSDQAVSSTYRILLPFVVENQLVDPPCFNRKRFELLKFDENLMMCVHLREVRTNYNKLQVKDEDFVDMENQLPQIRSSKKARKTRKW